jgi:predicted GIY-YIG superfamily endonuclease
MYCCYLIINSANFKTYIGSTNNLERRLKQHNKIIKGGAKYTTAFKGNGQWTPILIVDGFKEHKIALSFEWRMKRSKNNNGKLKPNSGYRNRIKEVFNIIESDLITNNGGNVSELEMLSIKVSNAHINLFDKVIDNNTILNLPLNTEIEINDFN